MRKIIPVMLILCLFLASCTASPGEQTTEQGKGAVGFSGGNVGEGGLMCGDNEGNVYYRSEADHWCLYKAKLDGSQKQRLSDDAPCDINVLDGWVYYANYRDGFSIYRIKTDGTSRGQLKSGYCGDLYVVGDHIYYDVRDEVNTSHIHRMDVDGSNDKLLVSEADLKYYYDGCLYYTNGRLFLCKYTLETGTSVQLNDKYSHYVTVDQSGVFCWYPDENPFVHMNYEGGDSKVILSGGGDYFNVCDNYVYYMKYGGNYDYYRLSLETGEKVQLSSFMAGLFDEKGNIIANPDAVSEDDHVFHEGGVGNFVIGGYAFVRGTLRESLLQNGRLDCLIRLDGPGNMRLWD